MTRIYISSKVKYAPVWRALRASGVPIISSWIDHETVTSWDVLWEMCVQEASVADVVIVYAEPGDVLAGALVEVGAALAAGRRVISVGCEHYTWTSHPQVRIAPTLELALELV
jgi:hypothetical protein